MGYKGISILVTVLLSIIVFDNVLADDAMMRRNVTHNDYNPDKFIGKWFIPVLILRDPKHSSDGLRCMKWTATKNPDGNFQIMSSSYDNGVHKLVKLNYNIKHSEMHRIPHVSGAIARHLIMLDYDNENKMLLYDKDSDDYMMLSRSTTMSNELMTKYRDLVRGTSYTMHNIDSTDCD